MFLQITDLGSTIYSYQIDQITEGNEDITVMAMASAEEEMKSYLSAPEWSDGRKKYDLQEVFNPDGSRNPLLVRIGVTLTKFYIIELCNADIIYNIAKERYDRAVAWLRQFAKEEISLDLPTTAESDPESSGTEPFIYGSREKFNHE